MKFKVRFRPQNTPDYPELSMVIDIDEKDLRVPNVPDIIEQERLYLLAAARLIRDKLVNNDIISVERIY